MRTKRHYFSPLTVHHTPTGPLNPSTLRRTAFLAEQANAFNNNKTVACSGIPQRKDFSSKSDIRRMDD